MLEILQQFVDGEYGGRIVVHDRRKKTLGEPTPASIKVEGTTAIVTLCEEMEADELDYDVDLTDYKVVGIDNVNDSVLCWLDHAFGNAIIILED